MDSFSISQLSQFSGIKPFTIRVWEQRYKALNPTRSEGNTRTYSGADLRRLLNIVTLQNAGFKISEIGGIPDAALNKLIGELLKNNNHDHENFAQFIPQLIAAGTAFNEREFSTTFDYCVAKAGIFETYAKVIYPLLDRIGVLWASNILPPAQEHFMCNLIRQKLLAEINALALPQYKSRKWLLLLPENEFHEIGLLFAHFILRHYGEQVISLGANVPSTTLSAAIENIRPEAVLLFFVHYDDPKNADAYLRNISEKFTNGPIYISGNQRLIEQLEADKQVKWLCTVDDLINTLNK